MKNPPQKINRVANAFTLVELMVVITIIVIVSAFATPAVTTILRGNKIARAGTTIAQELSRARQQALTHNRKTEVRFYKFTDPRTPAAENAYRGVQIFKTELDGTKIAIGNMKTLPEGVVMNETAGLSPLIANTLPLSGTKPKIPHVDTAYTAQVLEFLPDGSTALDPANKWFVTVHNEIDGASASTAPDNFYTVQIDPLLGTLRSHRP